MIASADPEVKRTALGEIRNFESEDASRIAVPALTDREEMVRATAAAAVVFLAPAEAAQLLVPLLNDKSPFVRRETAYALARVGYASTAEPVWQAFQKEKDLEVRSALTIALGGIGTLRSVEHLTAILRIPKREENEFIRRSAARSIGQAAEVAREKGGGNIADDRFTSEQFSTMDYSTPFPALASAASLLRNILRDTSDSADVRREAAFALGAVGDSSARPILESTAGSADPFIAANSKAALAKLDLIKPLQVGP
jgi:HEAT repeat protein